jgi:signal peptidase I
MSSTARPSHRQPTWWRRQLPFAGVIALGLVVRVMVVEPYQIPSGSMIPTLQIGDHLYVNKLAYGLRVPLTRSHLLTWADPERGDVIILPPPVAPALRDGFARMWDTPYIKRVIGLPGERVRMQGDQLLINGAPLDTIPGASSVPCGEVGPERRSPLCDRQRERAATRAWTTQHIDPSERGRGGRGFPDWPPRSAPRCPPGLDCSIFGTADTNPDWPELRIPAGHYLVLGDNRDNSHDGRFWGLIERKDVLGRASFIWWATDRSRLFQSVHEDP